MDENNNLDIPKDYLGLIGSGLDVNILLTQANSGNFPAIFFVWNKLKSFPHTLNVVLSGELLPYKNVMKVLKEQYNHNPDNDIVNTSYNVQTQYSHPIVQLSQIDESVMVIFRNIAIYKNLESVHKVDFDFEDYHLVTSSVQVFYAPGKKQFAEEFVKKISTITMRISKETSLQMICKNNCGFYLRPIKIKKPLITDLKLHYGEAFAKKHDTILESLKSDKSTGIVLLHGLPGTGKTHYIRYLIQEISSKQLIYVPPDLASAIATPEFFPFMLQHRDSILIIEDAENIIKSRTDDGTTTQAVANLLNLSDGLLGDSLHQPIIATFNCELSSIDPALLRKGRLISQHEFGKLDVEHAQKLSNELGFETTITEPMALCDIYGQTK